MAHSAGKAALTGSRGLYSFGHRMSQLMIASAPRLGVFHLSCWVIGLLAFLQIMTLAVALVLRPAAQPQVVEKVVPEYLYLPARQQSPAVSARVPRLEKEASPASGAAELTERQKGRSVPGSATGAPAGSRASRRYPPVADPVAERLVREAHEARIRSDHMQALLKLDEAEGIEPKHPVIHFSRGANLEAMGIYDKATEEYLEVYRLGPVKAGALWRKAARKLEKGIVPEMDGLTSLGVVRTSVPETTDLGEKHGVILPVAVALDQDFNSSLLETKVHFFEKQGGKIKQVTLPENQGYRWLTEPVDWEEGDETVEVWYQIPFADSQQQHLFGNRQFHGFVAELYYDGELVDVRAQPRTLIRKLASQQGAERIEDWDPILDVAEDYDPGNPLLPTLPD